MKQENYFFRETALLNLSKGICEVLSWDCYNFGYFKNGVPNFSGLLNRLISELSVYRDDLHEKFIWHYGGDVEKAREAENGIYQVYLNSFDLDNDNSVRIPFRVNAAHRKFFEKVYEDDLFKYDMNFTNYVRTLLGEYVIKPYYQRERFFYYTSFLEMKEAILQQSICRYKEEGQLITFIPLGLEPFFFNESGNCIVGISLPHRAPLIFPFRYAEKIRITDKTGEITDEDYDNAIDAWNTFMNEEKLKSLREQNP